MGKWWEKVNAYAGTAYYLALTELVFDELEDCKFKEGARILLDNAWKWLADHDAFSPLEMYYWVIGGPTIAQQAREATQGIPAPDYSDYGMVMDWLLSAPVGTKQRAIWAMTYHSGGAAIYNCYEYHGEGAQQDVDFPPDLLNDYWQEDLSRYEGIIVDENKSELLIAWLQENFPPGTEDKPVYKDEVMAVIQ